MSAILDNWLAGRGFPDAVVIDAHIHIGEWPHATTFRNLDEAVRQSVKTMDAHGVDAICALSGGYMWEAHDYRIGNNFLIEVCRRLPDRVIGFMHVNPNDTRKRMLNELDRMHDAGFRCIKLLNAYQEHYPGDGPNLMAVYEYAAKRRLLVFNHHWDNPVIMRISRLFPEADFVFAHYANYQDAVLKARKNVHANIWSMGSAGWLDRGIRAVGARKFSMGSDGFLNCMSVGIGPVVFAPISDDDKRLILGLNIARLLDKVGALPASLKAKFKAADSFHRDLPRISNKKALG